MLSAHVAGRPTAVTTDGGFSTLNIRKVHFSRVSFIWAGHFAYPYICLVLLKCVLLTSVTISVLAR
jgi:hypothetical protein